MIQRKQEYEALFNNAAIGIITVNSEGKIVLINEFALKKFGYTESELIGQKIETLIPKRFKQQHTEHRNHYIASKPKSRPMGTGMDLYAKTKTGVEFPVEVSLSTYMTNEGRFAIAFVSDITIRKESELALVKLNEELELKVQERTKELTEALEKEKDLSELKSRFVSMASHEFRTPLSTILSSAYLVTKYPHTEEQPKREKHIQRIISSVNTLTDILNDFLSVGKIEEGRIQVRFSYVNVVEIFTTLINELQTIVKPGQKIILEHSGKEEFWLDATLLKHIGMNLISNAVKFSPENSEIIIRLALDQKSFVLSIKDSGIGISKEDQQHLFERFFRGENVTNIQGTGLGLHIVSKYAELMNGKIKCKSELNKGTEFIINFKEKKSDI